MAGAKSTTEEKKESPPTTKIYLVCIGRRGINNQKQLAHAYYRITEKQARGEEAVSEDFGKNLDDATGDSNLTLCWKKLKWHVGACIEVEAKDESAQSVFSSTARLVGHWRNAEDLVRWKSYDQAWSDFFDAKKSLDKAKNENALRDALAPIREAYKQLPNVLRSQLIARVVQYIVR